MSVSKPIALKSDKWTGRDLNPRLPRCERGDHTELIYRPLGTFEKIAVQAHLEVSVSLIFFIVNYIEASSFF